MPHFIDETCINCSACASVCPVQCISEGDGKHDIDESICIDCDACTSVCPVGAISIR